MLELLYNLQLAVHAISLGLQTSEATGYLAGLARLIVNNSPRPQCTTLPKAQHLEERKRFVCLCASSSSSCGSSGEQWGVEIKQRLQNLGQRLCLIF